MPIPAKCTCPNCGLEHDYPLKGFFRPHDTRDVDLDKPLVEAWKDYSTSGCKKGLKFACAIEAEIGKVRENLTVAFDRIKALDTSTPERTSLVDLVHISSQENLEAACKIDTLERKVEKADDKLEATIDGCVATIENHELTYHGVEPKSQPQPDKRAKAKKVADLIQTEGQPWAWDKDHKELHELKPGMSVCSGRSMMEGLYLGHDDEFEIFYNPEESGFHGKNLWSLLPVNLTWLRDLDFPTTNPAGKPGGES